MAPLTASPLEKHPMAKNPPKITIPKALKALPSPAELGAMIKSAAEKVVANLPKPGGAPFHENDVVAFSVVLGNRNKNTRVDVRVEVLARVDGSMQVVTVVGPWDVPIQEAASFAGQVVSMLPLAVQPPLYAAVGTAAGAAGALEKMLLKQG
jgi:hypothetical protein